MDQAERRGTALLKSSAVVAFMTLLSRILGMVRDIVVARMVGSSAGADAFFVAFKIPNFLRRLFAEGAFAQAFVPVLSEYRTQRSLAQTRELIDKTAGMLTLALALVTLLAVAGAPLLTLLFAPGFQQDGAKMALTTEMLRITFPYLFFISLTAFCGSVLNSFGRFAVPAVTPIFLNLTMIAAALWLAPRLDVPVHALAWGVLAAGLVQLLFQFPFLLRLGLLPRPRLDWRHAGVRRIGRLMTPAIFGVSVSQINLLLDTILASFLETGSVSWLYYSDRLVELPLGVIGIAIATVILPVLSRRAARQEIAAFSATLDWGLRGVLLIGLPATMALVLLAEPLIFTFFQYGEMGLHDVERSAFSLKFYALGLIAFMSIKVVATGYFARQDTRTPVRIGIIAMVANMGFNLLLIWPLQHAGLALATALSGWLNAGLLLRGLLRAGIYRLMAGWLPFVLRITLANLLMGVLLWWLSPESSVWAAWGVWQRVERVVLLCFSGFSCYLLSLLLLGEPLIRSALSALLRRAVTARGGR